MYRKPPIEPLMSVRFRVPSSLNASSNVGAKSLQRFEHSQQRGNQLADGRMNMHRALQRGVRRVGIHDVDEGMDSFIGFYTKHRGAKYLLRCGIDQHLHETVG